MKHSFSLLACAAFLFSLVACTQELSSPEDQINSNIVRRSFVAGFEPDTKTTNKGNEVFWTSGDKINVIGAHTNTSAVASNLHDGNKRADFDAPVAQGDVIYAFYPYDSALSLSSDKLVTSVPQRQSGLFKDANIAAAIEDDGIFTFRNATSVFEFSVDSKVFPTVTQVIIESLSGSFISGDMSIEFLESSPWIDSKNGKNGSNRITVDLAQSRSQKLSAYAAVIPQYLNKGLIFHLADSKGKDVKTVTLSSSINLLPNRMYTFGDLSNFEHLDAQEFFAETFSNCRGNGGRDGDNMTHGDLIEDSDSNNYTDLEGWTLYQCYEASGCLAIGDDTHNSYAITPAIGLDESLNPLGLATMTFDSWTLGIRGNSSVGNLAVVGNGVISATHVALGKNGFTKVTVYLKYADSNTRIKFYGADYPNGQYYIDNVRLVDTAPSDFEYLNIPENVFTLEADQTSLVVPLATNASLTSSCDAPFVNTVFVTKTYARISLAPNTSTASRSTKVRLYSSVDTKIPELDKVQYIYFTQLGCPTIIGEKESLTFAAEGGSSTVGYKHWNFADDVVVTAESSVPGQFTATAVTGGFTITAAENTGDTKIQGTITLKAKDGEGREATYEIAVTQAAYPVVTLDKEAIAFPSTAADSTVNVSYKNFLGTVAVTAKSSNDAFSTSVKGDVVTISVQANETDEVIEGEVTITVSDGSSTKEKTVTVTQACLRSQTLSFSEASCNAYYDGEDFVAPTLSGAQTTVTYTISKNDFATVNSTTGALTFSPVANGTATVTATAAAENGYVEATASYTLIYKRLPADYTETEGLTSDGTQYIDTKFIPDQNTRVVVDYKNLSVKSDDKNGFIYGAAILGGNPSSDCFGVNISSSSVYAKYGSERAQVASPDTDEHVIDHNGKNFLFDGVSTVFTSCTFTCPTTMYLFHINASTPNTKHTPAKATIYSCKVYDNGTLVRDFVPCTKDGTAGLYDVKNGELYNFKVVPKQAE